MQEIRQTEIDGQRGVFVPYETADVSGWKAIVQMRDDEIDAKVRLLQAQQNEIKRLKTMLTVCETCLGSDTNSVGNYPSAMDQATIQRVASLEAEVKELRELLRKSGATITELMELIRKPDAPPVQSAKRRPYIIITS